MASLQPIYVQIVKILTMTSEIARHEEKSIQRMSSFPSEYVQIVNVWRMTSSITIYQDEFIQ